jgi:endonuclease-3
VKPTSRIDASTTKEAVPLRRRARRICGRLAETYPEAACSLVFDGPYQLLIATILSAQCTDRRVNAVTGPLFARWPGPADLAEAPLAAIERVVRSTGFYRAKARNIRGCAAALVERHGGVVPARLEELVRLPGVGRKTANVVLGSAMGRASGIVVDTHVGRLSRRLGLTAALDPVKVERDLVGIVPRRHWIALSHWLIEHGRAVCRSRRPRCEGCVLARMCPRVGVGP